MSINFDDFDEENIDFEDFDEKIDKKSKPVEKKENDDDEDNFNDNVSDEGNLNNNVDDDDYNTETPYLENQNTDGESSDAETQNGSDITDSPYFESQNMNYANNLPYVNGAGYSFDNEEYLKKEKEFREKSEKIKRVIGLVGTLVFALLTAITIFQLIIRNVKKKKQLQNNETTMIEDIGNLNDYLSSETISESKNDKMLESLSNYEISMDETRVSEQEETETIKLNETKASESFVIESKSSPYDDYMKLPKSISEESATNERLSDVNPSPYFTTQDWYNAVSNANLCIISNFKTSQAKSNADNALEVLKMIANYYEVAENLSTDMFNKVKEQHANLHTGICVNQMEELLSEIGLEYNDNDLSEANLESIRNFLSNSNPVLVGLNRWGCSWSIIIGYDDMGTDDFGDDMVILADSTDITDHCQDGYIVMHALEFLNYWNFGDMFKNEEKAQNKAMNCFIAVTGYKSRKVG